jgi:hypothetical protein
MRCQETWQGDDGGTRGCQGTWVMPQKMQGL